MGEKRGERRGTECWKVRNKKTNSEKKKKVHIKRRQKKTKKKRIKMNNNPYPYLNNERNQHNVILSNNQYDHDYLIETERNVTEIDQRIIRIAAANESQARRMARISNNNTSNQYYSNYLTT